MKIKRFEASSMSDALRAVKKEFGEDAVILSAKTVKKTNSLFGGKRKKQVVVTAAIDHAAKSAGDTGMTDQGTLSEIAATKNDPDRNDPRIQGIAPITRTGQKKLQSKFFRLASETQKSGHPDPVDTDRLYDRLLGQGLDAKIARDWAAQVEMLTSAERQNQDSIDLRSAFSQVIQSLNLIPAARQDNKAKQRKLVLVGPAGVGKTTMAAKLAADARMKSQAVTVLSLDNYRIAGAEELERYARIIGFQLATPGGVDDIRKTLDRCCHDELVIVDTPGIGIKDRSIRDDLVEMVTGIGGVEIHLLLNAGFQHAVMAAALNFFKPMGVQRLVFTHLDWVTEHGALFNTVAVAGLPISYLCDGTEIPEGLQSASIERLTDLLIPHPQKVQNDPVVTVVRAPQGKALQDQFLANRNSDIFHRPECRSVQRMNNDNLLVFKNEIDAMARNYKPCRMCCPDLLVSKTTKTMAYRPNAIGRCS